MMLDRRCAFKICLVLVYSLFYGPSTQFRSFRARSVTRTTLFQGKPLGSLPVLSAHSFASNWQLVFLNQRKRENGRRIFFITTSPRKNVPDLGIELGAACMPSGHASDPATAPGLQNMVYFLLLTFQRRSFWSGSSMFICCVRLPGCLRKFWCILVPVTVTSLRH